MFAIHRKAGGFIKGPRHRQKKKLNSNNKNKKEYGKLKIYKQLIKHEKMLNFTYNKSNVHFKL